MEEIFRKKDLSESDLIRARTLKNKMTAEQPAEETPVRAVPVDAASLKAGDRVLVGAMGGGGNGAVRAPRQGHLRGVDGRAPRKCKDLRSLCRRAQGARQGTGQGDKEPLRPAAAKRELNIIGMTTAEGVAEAEAFLDAAVVANLQEVRIVHGYGTGKLRAAVHEMLRRNPRVEAFRLGKYGEGEGGVTVVTLR